MGTKNKPGDFDCYSAAEPDEPMFVLLGRDPMAGALVCAWAAMREEAGEDPAKVKEARDCADALDAWTENQKHKKPFGSVLVDALDVLGWISTRECKNPTDAMAHFMVMKQNALDAIAKLRRP